MKQEEPDYEVDRLANLRVRDGVEVGVQGLAPCGIDASLASCMFELTECTLGQKYRIVRADGHVSGGPMHYLRDGLAELGWTRTGRVLAVIFALMCIGGSFGGGNMYQSNQAFAQFATVLPSLGGTAGAVGFGFVLAIAVGAFAVPPGFYPGLFAMLPNLAIVVGWSALSRPDPKTIEKYGS